MVRKPEIRSVVLEETSRVARPWQKGQTHATCEERCGLRCGGPSCNVSRRVARTAHGEGFSGRSDQRRADRERRAQQARVIGAILTDCR